MSGKPLMILVDNNVWLDCFLPNRPSKDVSQQLVSRALMRGDHLLYPVGALQDIFYILISESKRYAREAGDALTEELAGMIQALAWENIETIREAATAVGADEADVWVAGKLRREGLDLEDGMVVAAAMRAKADYLVSSDERLIKKASVPALSPADMLALLG